MSDVLNKSMSRADLLGPEGQATRREIDALVRALAARGLSPSSWVGTLPRTRTPAGWRERVKQWMGRLPSAEESLGLDQRLDYEPLPDAADDRRLPWFLYWEIHWVMRHTRPLLRPGVRLFDGGGAASLFSFFLASLGHEVHAVDLNEKLVAHGNRVAQEMGWSYRAHAMNLAKLEFPDAHFDHAYSICVFEHLDYDLKIAALGEISRCLKPGGILSLTFDWRNPAPGVVGVGKDPRPRNRLATQDDLERSFLSAGDFEVVGNRDFHDDGTSWLVHPRFDHAPYTFGALFLRRR